MKKTVRICDSCGAEVDPLTGGWLRASHYDSRRSAKYADLCLKCMDALPGVAVPKRGRPARVPA